MKLQVPSYSSPATLNSSDQVPPSAPVQPVPDAPAAPETAKGQKPNGKDPNAVDRKDLDQIVEQMNKTLEVYNYDLKFEIVDKHRVVISIINSSTGEVLKQIPPEDVVRSFKQMDAFLGMLVDRKV